MPRGPIPKPDHERIRRNKDAVFTPIAGGVSPPAARGFYGWCREVREWWQAIKTGSVARGYSKSDWQVALRAARIFNDAETLRNQGKYLEAKSLMTEVRQLEDRLLTTLRARRSARVAEDEEPPLPASADSGGEDELQSYRNRLTQKS